MKNRGNGRVKERATRALVVEDCRTVRRILREYLSNLEIQSLEAGNGCEGLEVLEKLEPDGWPDFVLVDWDMPVMNGAEFIREVRSREEYADVLLIVVTTQAPGECLRHAMEAGADAFMPKPKTLTAFQLTLGMLGFLNGAGAG